MTWPTVRWVRDDSVTTTVGGCPAGTEYTTSEALYRTGPHTVIATVDADDVDRYGLAAHAIAFMWTNNIRYAVNGWNATKDAMPSPVASGVVPVLPGRRRLGLRAGHEGRHVLRLRRVPAQLHRRQRRDLPHHGPAGGRALLQPRRKPRWQRNQWVKVTLRTPILPGPPGRRLRLRAPGPLPWPGDVPAVPRRGDGHGEPAMTTAADSTGGGSWAAPRSSGSPRCWVPPGLVALRRTAAPPGSPDVAHAGQLPHVHRPPPSCRRRATSRSWRCAGRPPACPTSPRPSLPLPSGD